MHFSTSNTVRKSRTSRDEAFTGSSPGKWKRILLGVWEQSQSNVIEFCNQQFVNPLEIERILIKFNVAETDAELL